MKYFEKMKGVTKSPPRVNLTEMCLSWAGAFAGIAAVGLIHHLVVRGFDLALMFGPWGASAALLFGAPKSPLAQPRNVIGGHLMSAAIGVAMFKLFPDLPVLAASLAVSTAIAAMHGTKTLHPPAGATALIAVIGDAKIHSLGFVYAAAPVGIGSVLLVLVALLFNNIPANRRYPEFWL